MKTLLAAIVVLMGSLATATAQDFYLPSSSKSKKAVATMQQAADLYANVHIAEGNAKIEQALADDPAMFMAYVYAVQYAPNSEKNALIEKALAIDTKNLNKAENIMRGLMEEWQKDPKYKPTEEMKALVAAYPKTPQATEWASLHAFYTERNLDAAWTTPKNWPKCALSMPLITIRWGICTSKKRRWITPKRPSKSISPCPPRNPMPTTAWASST